VSLREFDGWTPARETVHEYDDDGRLARSVERAESPWDDEQRGWMVAYAEWEATRCPLCGGDPDECSSEGSYGRWKTGPVRRCQKTHEVRVAQAARAKTVPAGTDDHPGALLWRVVERGSDV
jgi:hypothetical protein